MTTLTEQWIQITPTSEVPLREGREVKLGNLSIALFNLGDRWMAIENRCPHGQGPLADGIVGGFGTATTVTCPLHNRRICLDSGEVVKPQGLGGPCVRTFPVKVEEGIVMLDVQDSKLRECAAKPYVFS